MSLDSYRKAVDALLRQRATATATVAAERQAAADAAAELAATTEAQRAAQSIAQQVQQTAHGKVARVVSRCLSAVFETPYEFEILFEQKRGKTEAELLFKRNGRTVDPTGAAGGGVVDVAALALRLACMRLARPTVRPVLFLDEPFRFVDADNTLRVRLLLETLAEEMGVQFILVTHEPKLVAGTVVEIA